MIVFLNGQFVPEEQAVISVFDRGFLYGDGLFETICIFKGKPFRWEQHFERLKQGAEFLKIQLPSPTESLRESADELIARNRLPGSLLRLTLSRGIGVRGYSPKRADRPSVVMSLHPVPAVDLQNPPPWRVVTSSLRLPANEPLAQFKTCNKLPQILARAEADAAGADEALLLNTDGHAVEGTSSNLFWVEHDAICTPPLTAGILPGVTRSAVLEICQQLGISHREMNVIPEMLRQRDGVFFSLTSVGIAEGISLDGHALAQSALVSEIRSAYWKLLLRECQ